MGQPQKNRRARGRPLLGRLTAFLRDPRANIAPLMALLLVPLIGAVSVGIEVSNWYTSQRAMQNAADSAAVAAAMNNNSATYQEESRLVAAKYGYVNGQNNTTVTPINGQPCPDGTSDCYRVTIQRNIPIYLAGVVGYRGDVSGNLKAIAATALATNGIEGYCMWTLAHGVPIGTNSMTFNGVPAAALKDCYIHSNTSVKCNGNNLFDASLIDAPGNVTNCDEAADSINDSASALADPYSSKTDQIPPTGSCTSGNLMQSQSWTAPVVKCGNVSLGENITVNGDTTNGAILVIAGGGSLNMNGFNLTGTNLTVIFTGAAGTTPGQIINTDTHSTPVFSVAAPTTDGATYHLSGMAVYQDPRMTGTSAWTYRGGATHQIQWAVQGIMYLPYVDFTLNGSINKVTYACLSLVTDKMTIGGTGYIFADPTSECDRAGASVPGVDSRARLVR